MPELKTLILALVALLASAAAAGTLPDPAAEVRETVEGVLQVLADKRSEGGDRWERVRALIRPRFDFAEMAKRTLGSRWRALSEGEQREFVDAFTAFLERSYAETIESYDGERVACKRALQEGRYAQVDTRIRNRKGEEFSIQYRLHAVENRWKVYDVVIENISLVNNYRSQFNRVLAEGSLGQLIRRLREKGAASSESSSLPGERGAAWKSVLSEPKSVVAAMGLMAQSRERLFLPSGSR